MSSFRNNEYYDSMIENDLDQYNNMIHQKKQKKLSLDALVSRSNTENILLSARKESGMLREYQNKMTKRTEMHQQQIEMKK